MKRFPIAALFCVAAAAAIVTSPARAQRLTGTVAPTASAGAKANAKKQEPLNGFQDIKWGDSIEKVTKILQAKGATVTKHTGSEVNAQNVLTVSTLKVADFDTNDIMLRFGSEGFYQADVAFSQRAGTNKVHDDLRLIITERFGDATPDRAINGLGGGGFGGLGSGGLQWIFDPSNKEPASLKLQNVSGNRILLEYRATDRAEREEGRIRAEKAKSL